MEQPEGSPFFILDAVASFVIVVDATGQIRYCNAAAGALVGVSQEEAVGRPIWDFITLSGRIEADKARFAVISNGPLPTQIETDWLAQRGTLRRISWSVGPWRDPRTEKPFLVYTGTDISTVAGAGHVNDPDVWFRKIIETAHEGIGLIDAHGVLTYVNPRLAEMVGWTVQELVGRKFFEFQIDTPLETGEQRLSRRKAGIRESYEVQLRHKNGSSVWVLMNANPIVDDRGEMIASLGMVFDISGRRAAEEALRENEERFRLVVENSPDLVFHQDENLIYTWISKTIPPTRVEDILGHTDFDVIEPIQAAQIFQAKTRVLKTGVTERLENNVMLEGKPYHFQTDVVRRTDAGGRVLGVAGYCRDVTASKLAEQALIELNATLEQRVAERTETLRRQTQILHSVLDGMGDGVLVCDEKGNFVLHNQALERISGPRSHASIPTMANTVHLPKFFKADGITPYEVMDLPLSRAVTGEQIDDEEMCIRRPNLPDRWISVAAMPLRDEHGRIHGGVSVSRDFTERKRAAEALRASEEHHRRLAERNRLLVLEVEHRVGNNLAGLLGLVAIMRGRTKDVDAFADAMEVRLRGMAHVHRMLTETQWTSISLRELIASALRVLRDPSCYFTQENLEGPPVDIPADRVQALTLIVLELYTNSCKYGAHSVADGKLSVHWTIEPAESGAQIHLTWRERGGPPITGPVTPSLGTQLIRAFTARELKGWVEMEYAPQGAQDALRFPPADTKH